MESAFAWLTAIVEWLGKFIPRLQIIRTTHAGVKFVKGSRVVPLQAGWHWYWPFTTECEIYPIARQAVDLRSQTIVTTDDKVLAVGGFVVYEIVDIEKILAHTFDADETIKDIVLGAIHDVCCQLSWDALKQQQRSGQLDRALRAEAKKGLDSYGVKVIRTTLTDLAPCRVVKLLNEGSVSPSIAQIGDHLH